MTGKETPPEAKMMQFILGKWISRPIYTAAELGLADLLAEGPKNTSELARLTNTRPDLLRRLIRALASVGIFALGEDDLVESTPLSECLRNQALGPAALMFLSNWHDQAWSRLTDCLRTGRPGFEAAHGRPAFEWFEDHREAARVFHQANAHKAAATHRAIIEVYDFSQITSLTDVGGGGGALPAEILSACPHLTGVVADRPEAILAAEKLFEDKGLSDRAKTIACDFFESVPPGGQALMLSHVLHDWEDHQALKILKNCRRVAPPDGRLLILENLITPGPGFCPAKLMDLEVLVMGGGRERTENELRSLVRKAGFEPLQTIPAGGGLFVLEAGPA